MSETGNVYYPQSEMNTVLLPVSNGCPYNQCAFCSMYKDEKYREVPLQEIDQEIFSLLWMCGSLCFCEKY